MQLEIIRTLQSLRDPILTVFFELITGLGGPSFYVAILPLLFWCISTRVGYRFVIVVLISAYLNSLIKDLGPLFTSTQGLLHSVRPFRADPQQVWTCRSDPLFDPKALLARLCYEEESRSFPSGHAQTSIVAWGYIVAVVRRQWFTAIAAIWVVLIGLSRLYLGQHWPTDVVGGWLIGAAILGVALGVFSFWQGHSQALNWLLLLLMVVLVPTALLLDPDPTFNRARALGLIAGCSIAYALQVHYAPFIVRAGWLVQIAKIIIGMLGIVAIQIGLAAVLPRTRTIEFVLALLTGIWALFIAPLLFGLIWGRPASERAEKVAEAV